MISFEATVVFLPTSLGGLKQKPWPGMRPAFCCLSGLYSCIVYFAPGLQPAHDVELRVAIGIGFGEDIPLPLLQIGQPFTLNMASIVIATGTITGELLVLDAIEDVEALASLMTR